MEGMLLSDFEGLTLGQMAGLGEEVEITLEYLESRMFDNDYKRFLDFQDEYTFVPHKEENIERLIEQNENETETSYEKNYNYVINSDTYPVRSRVLNSICGHNAGLAADVSGVFEQKL